MIGARFRRILLLVTLAVGAFPGAAAAAGHDHATHHVHGVAASAPGARTATAEPATPPVVPAPALAAHPQPGTAPHCPGSGDCGTILHCALSSALAPASQSAFPAPRPRRTTVAMGPHGPGSMTAPSPPVPPPVSGR